MLGNGNTTPILKYGTNTLSTRSKYLKLNHLLLVPSVTIFADNDVKFEFFPHNFCIKEASNGKILLFGRTN